MLKDYGIKKWTMNIHCDNFSAINISKNPDLYSYTKHIEIHHHFIGNLVKENIVSLEFIRTEHNW